MDSDHTRAIRERIRTLKAEAEDAASIRAEAAHLENCYRAEMKRLEALLATRAHLSIVKTTLTSAGILGAVEWVKHNSSSAVIGLGMAAATATATTLVVTQPWTIATPRAVDVPSVATTPLYGRPRRTPLHARVSPDPPPKVGQPTETTNAPSPAAGTIAITSPGVTATVAPTAITTTPVAPPSAVAIVTPTAPPTQSHPARPSPRGHSHRKRDSVNLDAFSLIHLQLRI